MLYWFIFKVSKVILSLCVYFLKVTVIGYYKPHLQLINVVKNF